MSSIANLTSTASALPAVNIRPHGHKHGSHVNPTDDSGSDTAAQVPAGTVQNLFGSLLQTLEQVIGVQSAPTTASPAPAASSAAAGATAGAAPAQTASTQLQNYLNNLAQNLNAPGAQVPKFAGPMFRVTV